MVFVTKGKVRDFVLDMRVGSPTFKEHYEVHLSADAGALMIPAGCAHGFEVVEGPAIVNYAQEGAYDLKSDTGIRITSTSIELRTPNPVISVRDSQLPDLHEFDSPFIFGQVNRDS
jgi:dTDP-4-dehydrorhamnose 3,5-epimerase-like enzyme